MNNFTLVITSLFMLMNNVGNALNASDPSKDFDPDFYNNKYYSEHSYICVPSAKSGFKYNKVTRKWDSVTNSESSDKKLLKFENNKWILSNFGASTAVATT